MTTQKEKYNFGEKEEEFINGKNVPVTFFTPKYKEAKKKAIELLESKEYKDKLLESDFWILVNTYANKTKAMYSGLIISHDGCLKINDTLDEKLKFKPECMSIDKDGYNNSLVFTYICKEQGIYEVGEVNKANCKNDYPYAMALKRCMDRVILKNSKIAYAGIYSDSESEEFSKKEEVIENDIESKKNKSSSKQKASKMKIQEDQAKRLQEIYTVEEIIPLLKSIGRAKVSELTLLEASYLINKKTKETSKEGE